MTRYYQNIENKSRNQPDVRNGLKLGENKKPRAPDWQREAIWHPTQDYLRQISGNTTANMTPLGISPTARILSICAFLVGVD